MIKEYKLSKKIRKKIIEYYAANQLVQKMIAAGFFKESIEYQIKSVNLRYELWSLIYQAYPDLKGKRLEINGQDKILVQYIEPPLEIFEK